MKHLITILLAFAWVAGQAKDVVIERPAFRTLMRSGYYCKDLYPVKVELTKTATVVHFHMRCAAWRNWSMAGGRLEAEGQQFAYQKGRILTHDGKQVLADEVFEIGKEYEKNAQQDSVILYFDPLPKGTKTFDYIESDNPRAWVVYGIRTDKKLYPSLLPAPQTRVDDGKPLEPMTLKYGDATVSCTMLGDTINGFSWFGDPSCDPITGDYRVKVRREGATVHYSNPSYTARLPLFIGSQLWLDGFGNQYDLLLVPGETLTLDFDPAACEANLYDFAGGKPANKGYHFGGSIGDLNEVLLEDRGLNILSFLQLPDYKEVKDFPEWRDKLWQNLDTLRQSLLKRKDYTRRQKDFASLLIDRTYMRAYINCVGLIGWVKRLENADSTLAHLKNTYTLVDPHAKDVQFCRDGRSFWLPLTPEILPYLEANGITETEPYKMTKAMVEAKKIGNTMKQGKILPEDSIKKAHPYFQRVLREFNDSNRVQLERLQREAKERMMPTPDVPGDKLLETIVKEHPGKVIFFDLWATWCGPCKRGIEAMEPLKEELKGKDVVFIYLTDESSFMNEWSESVLKIPGLHYRMPSSKWNEIPNLSGIPQYYIFDRQGNKIWEQTGFSNEVLEDIRKQLDDALK